MFIVSFCSWSGVVYIPAAGEANLFCPFSFHLQIVQKKPNYCKLKPYFNIFAGWIEIKLDMLKYLFIDI